MTQESYHNDIEGDVRKHFAFISENRAMIKEEEVSRLSALEIRQFGLNDSVPETTAIDSSSAPLYRASSMWLIAVRALSLRYKFNATNGTPAYELQGQEINEGAELVTTSGKIAEGLSDLARELAELTVPRKSLVRTMADYIRMLKEIQLANSAARSTRDSIILMDGTLSPPTPRLIRRLAEETALNCRENRNALVGISKDSSGNLLGSIAPDEEMLRTIDRTGMLFVKVPENKEATHGPKRDVFFVKFHPEAPKWFRVDVSAAEYDPRTLFGSIAQYAQNQLCPGYPLPLAEAHIVAVMIRKYPRLYDELLLRVGHEMGFTLQEIVWGRTNIEGRRMDAFHTYLDAISKRGAPS